MIENYIFNESEKRFEPLEKKCTYCGAASVEKIDDCYFIPLFMKKDSTNLIVYRSVKFAKILIGIPRCVSCKEIHQKANTNALMLSWGIALVLLIFLFYNIIAFGGVVLGIGFFAAIFIGIYGTAYFNDKFAVDNGIYPLKDGAETNEVIHDLVISGWTFEQPAP